MTSAPAPVSLLVPTWNEALWLPRLLRAVSEDGRVTEVVVADNDSTDGTRELAERAGCRVVRGGRPGLARNAACAAAARGDWLLFVDADVLPTTAALDAVFAATARRVACVAFRHVPMTDRRFVRACYRVADLWFVCARAIGVRQGLASFLLVRRDAFEAVGGFDEHLEPGEDVDFVQRVGRVADVEYERAAVVLISSRRFATDHPLAFALKTVVWSVLRTIGSRRSPWRYRWNSHAATTEEHDRAWLDHSRRVQR